jgi:aspartate kinase
MEIKVFKFGGASVKGADGVRNIATILRKQDSADIVVVLSAMGKTTNALEELVGYFMTGDAVSVVECFFRIRQFHFDIIDELFTRKDLPVYHHVEALFIQLQGYLKRGQLTPGRELIYDFEYDQIVCYGELISTVILNYFLNESGIPSTLFDARDLIKTNTRYRDAKVDWKLTQANIQKIIQKHFSSGKPAQRVVVTQGFIGSDRENNSTTLGREGSDYTAAIFAYALKTKEVTIWKDVPGILNADPKWFRNAKKIARLSYREAIELAYFGASVIHPKTIKPLENAKIILKVKSFLQPQLSGTSVENLKEWRVSSPLYILKKNQVLLSISPRDFSFIVEENLSQIFDILAKHRVKVNVMQNSAISFSVCVDGDHLTNNKCIAALQQNYTVRYNDNLELYTIRHYNQAAINRIIKNRKVLLEQKTRSTVHLVIQ